jgi:hypothetical protein
MEYVFFYLMITLLIQLRQSTDSIIVEECGCLLPSNLKPLPDDNYICTLISIIFKLFTIAMISVPFNDTNHDDVAVLATLHQNQYTFAMGYF